MLVAGNLRKQNLSEYLLLLFHTEDTIRAMNRDLGMIEEKIIVPSKLPESSHKELVDWYANLLLMMEKEKIQEKGHFQFIINLINDLNDFHLRLLENQTDSGYTGAYRNAAGLITELRHKGAPGTNEVETALSALYGYLLLKLKKQPVSTKTLKAMEIIGVWMGKLSHLFRLFESGDLEL
jgi:hypothetical protein